MKILPAKRFLPIYFEAEFFDPKGKCVFNNIDAIGIKTPVHHGLGLITQRDMSLTPTDYKMRERESMLKFMDYVFSSSREGTDRIILVVNIDPRIKEEYLLMLYWLFTKEALRNHHVKVDKILNLRELMTDDEYEDYKKELEIKRSDYKKASGSTIIPGIQSVDYKLKEDVKIGRNALSYIII